MKKIIESIIINHEILIGAANLMILVKADLGFLNKKIIYQLML